MTLPIDPCGYAVDSQRVCGYFWVKPWRNRPDLVLVRTYRVPDDTPALPFAHRFLMPQDDGAEFAINPPEGGGPNAPLVGFLHKMVRYDKGAPPPGWRPPTHYVGTLEQWQEGSVWPRDQPLDWQAGFSTACRAACAAAEGEACGVGCDQCPLVSELWCISGFEDFAGLTEAVVTKRQGCYFSTECVPCGDSGYLTSPAWSVSYPTPFAGLTPAALPWRGQDWNNCCQGRTV